MIGQLPQLGQRAQALVSELAERGIRTVAVTFVNHAGSVLVKGCPLRRLPLVARDGVGFSPVADAFGATGLIDPLQSLARPDGDLRLVPDLESPAVLDAAGGWAWAAGNRYSLEGVPYEADQSAASAAVSSRRSGPWSSLCRRASRSSGWWGRRTMAIRGDPP